MCQRTIFSRSASRFAEEIQLQAEEEFMVEALKMIKQQRNCLQIERLHLESLRQQLMNPINEEINEENEQATDPGSSRVPTNPTSESKPAELMSAVDMMNLGRSKHTEADMDADMQCNNQALNLALGAPTLGMTSKPTYNQYYNSDDDGSSSDASNGDDVMIDMNMMMHGGSEQN